MRETDFLSLNNYIYLPTKKNPKVVLAVDSAVMSKNSYQLYNPFSSKAKAFKKVTAFLFSNCNRIARLFWQVHRGSKSSFIRYLEAKLGLPLVSSIYFATAKDKVVLQLQNREEQIIGYIKYPISEIGIKHIETEHRAIKALSAQGIIQDALIYDYYNDNPYLLLTNLDGKTGIFENKQIEKLLLKFTRGEAFLLKDHPRILSLKKSLNNLVLNEYLTLLERVCLKSSKEYALAFEHGDFAPWNIIEVNEELTPFDFEYFVENGIEDFDLIKYHFQVGRLILGKESGGLIAHIFENTELAENESLLILYLLKEIIRNKEENETSDFEVKMLGELEKFDE